MTPAQEGPQRRRNGTPAYYSPLRYPGGKRKLADFLALLLRANRLLDGEYAEAYAGGASVALALLFGEYVERVHINDLHPGVYAFWMTARDHPDDLCRRIRDARLDVHEWDRQRAVQRSSNPDRVDLAFSTFYLNRTNRSGILTGGLIGGRDQTGPWQMDARFSRSTLIRRIERIGRWRSRISVHGLDAKDFLSSVVAKMPARSLVYLDPPYYVKGREQLYANFYEPDDHAVIAAIIRKLILPWVVTYDDVDEVRSLYRGHRSKHYGISYSAGPRDRGREVMFFSEDLTIPSVTDPTKLARSEVSYWTGRGYAGVTP